MKEITREIKDVAKLKGMYARSCEDSFNSDKNFMVGVNGDNENISYFKTIREIEFYLGIREEEIIKKGDGTFLKERKYSLDQIRYSYKKECEKAEKYESDLIKSELERERKHYEEYTK